jgi:hypothetical protein
VYPSRHRGAGERLRQVFTQKRPYRCHNCGWREWAEIDVQIPDQPDVDPRSLRRPHPDRPLTGDEIDGLDLSGEQRPAQAGPTTTGEQKKLEPNR